MRRFLLTFCILSMHTFSGRPAETFSARRGRGEPIRRHKKVSLHVVSGHVKVSLRSGSPFLDPSPFIQTYIHTYMTNSDIHQLFDSVWIAGLEDAATYHLCNAQDSGRCCHLACVSWLCALYSMESSTVPEGAATWHIVHGWDVLPSIKEVWLAQKVLQRVLPPMLPPSITTSVFNMRYMPL